VANEQSARALPQRASCAPMFQEEQKTAKKIETRVNLMSR
jgi:hypothetical protein